MIRIFSPLILLKNVRHDYKNCFYIFFVRSKNVSEGSIHQKNFCSPRQFLYATSSVGASLTDGCRFDVCLGLNIFVRKLLTCQKISSLGFSALQFFCFNIFSLKEKRSSRPRLPLQIFCYSES